MNHIFSIEQTICPARMADLRMWGPAPADPAPAGPAPAGPARPEPVSAVVNPADPYMLRPHVPHAYVPGPGIQAALVSFLSERPGWEAKYACALPECIGQCYNEQVNVRYRWDDRTPPRYRYPSSWAKFLELPPHAQQAIIETPPAGWPVCTNRIGVTASAERTCVLAVIFEVADPHSQGRSQGRSRNNVLFLTTKPFGEYLWTEGHSLGGDAPDPDQVARAVRDSMAAAAALIAAAAAPLPAPHDIVDIRAGARRQAPALRDDAFAAERDFVVTRLVATLETANAHRALLHFCSSAEIDCCMLAHFYHRPTCNMCIQAASRHVWKSAGIKSCIPVWEPPLVPRTRCWIPNCVGACPANCCPLTFGAATWRGQLTATILTRNYASPVYLSIEYVDEPGYHMNMHELPAEGAGDDILDAVIAAAIDAVPGDEEVRAVARTPVARRIITHFCKTWRDAAVPCHNHPQFKMGCGPCSHEYSRQIWAIVGARPCSDPATAGVQRR
jgi:hypothetical protein